MIRILLCACITVDDRRRRLTFTTIYINLHNLHTLFLLVLSLFYNNFILIGHSKQCVQSRRTRGVLKIERYEQRLTHRACMEDASSYSYAPGVRLTYLFLEHFQPVIFNIYCFLFSVSVLKPAQ